MRSRAFRIGQVRGMAATLRRRVKNVMERRRREFLQSVRPVCSIAAGFMYVAMPRSSSISRQDAAFSAIVRTSCVGALQLRGAQLQRFLRRDEFLLRALPREQNALCVLQRDRTQDASSSSSSGSPTQRPPSFSEASAVPRTRARIFANAVSRVVDVSSLNGENPQSSRRAQLLDRDVLGRLEHAVADLLRCLDARIDRRHDADEDALIRLHVLADDLAGRESRSFSPASAM